MASEHRQIPGLLRGADWCTPCHAHCGGHPPVLCGCCQAAGPEEMPAGGKHKRPEQAQEATGSPVPAGGVQVSPSAGPARAVQDTKGRYLPEAEQAG